MSVTTKYLEGLKVKLERLEAKVADLKTLIATLEKIEPKTK